MLLDSAACTLSFILLLTVFCFNGLTAGPSATEAPLFNDFLCAVICKAFILVADAIDFSITVAELVLLMELCLSSPEESFGLVFKSFDAGIIGTEEEFFIMTSSSSELTYTSFLFIFACGLIVPSRIITALNKIP